MSPNYRGLFEAWEIAIAKKLVSEFQRRWKRLRREDFDDLLQECLTHWFFVKERYDPREGVSQKAFMRQVVKNKLGNIRVRIYAEKRKAFYRSISLEKPVEKSEGILSLIDKIPASKDSPRDLASRKELKLKLRSALHGLTAQQKTLCRLIKDEDLNITEASKRLDINRRTAYDELKRIRKIFIKQGLKEYLK